MTRREFWTSQVGQQRQWMQDHGGDVAGYIERYGFVDDPRRYGEGGVAIYRADYEYLDLCLTKARKLGATV